MDRREMLQAVPGVFTGIAYVQGKEVSEELRKSEFQVYERSPEIYPLFDTGVFPPHPPGMDVFSYGEEIYVDVNHGARFAKRIIYSFDMEWKPDSLDLDVWKSLKGDLVAWWEQQRKSPPKVFGRSGIVGDLMLVSALRGIDFNPDGTISFSNIRWGGQVIVPGNRIKLKPLDVVIHKKTGDKLVVKEHDGLDKLECSKYGYYAPDVPLESYRRNELVLVNRKPTLLY